MQRKQDALAGIITLPCKTLQEVSLYLSEVLLSMGYTASLSELICDAIDLLGEAERGNEKLKEERDDENYAS